MAECSQMVKESQYPPLPGSGKDAHGTLLDGPAHSYHKDQGPVSKT